MTLEEQEALKDGEVVEAPVESPATEPETPVELTETIEEPTSPDEGETIETEEEAGTIKKKSAQSRIQQLNAELKKERERNRSLEETVHSVHKENEENPFSPENNPLPEISEPNQNGEITREQYVQDVQKNAQRAVQMVLLKQNQAQEARKAMEMYPQLDPNSDQFDQDISDAITETVDAQSRLNPRISVLATVNKLMKPYKKAAENAVSGHQRDIAHQVATAGIRPTQNAIPPKTKTPDEMTEAELEAKLGKVYG